MKRPGARLERPARAPTKAKDLEQPARRRAALPEKRHKYAAQKVKIDGYTFDSKAEGRRYGILRQLEQIGAIGDLEVHPKFPIEIDGRPLRIRSEKMKNGRQVVYAADFRYVDIETGATVIEDVKGFDNARGRLKRALAEHVYGIEITVLSKGGGRT